MEGSVDSSPLAALTDADLLGMVRVGDESAFTELYARHREVACRMASTFCRRADTADLADLAFEKVLGALRRGSGPTGAFRAYLFVTLRRLAAEQAQRPKEQSLDELPEAVVSAADGPPLDPTERELITAAFESLPDRWQAVLWHTAVEGRHPRELSSILGASANAISALAYRAREKLRQAYLQAHLQATPRPQCEPHRSLLGAYVRDGQSRRDRHATREHVYRCDSCRALVDELNDVNRLLARAILPLFLAGSVGHKAAAAAAAGGAGVAEVGGRGLSRSLPGWLRTHYIGSAIGVAAAATALVVGVQELGPHFRETPSRTETVAGTTEEPSTVTDALTSTTAAPEQAGGAAVAALCQAGEAAAPGAEGAAPGAPSTLVTAPPTTQSGLLSPLLVPVLSLVPDITLNPPEPGDVARADVRCEPTEDGRGDLTVVVGNTVTEQPTTTGGEPPPLVPVDAEVTIDLSDGAHIDVEAGLPGGCDIDGAGQSLICTLEDAAPGLPTEATVGVQVDAGEGEAAATVTVRDGDQTILNQAVDLSPITGLLTPEG